MEKQCFFMEKCVLQVSGWNTFENAYKITSKIKFSTQNVHIPYHLHPALSNSLKNGLTAEGNVIASTNISNLLNRDESFRSSIIPTDFLLKSYSVDGKTVFFRFLAGIRLRAPIKSPQKASSRPKTCKFRTTCTLPEATVWVNRNSHKGGPLRGPIKDIFLFFSDLFWSGSFL